MNELSPAPAPESDEVEIGDLSRSLGFLLRLAQIQIFGEFYRTLAGHGLKPGEFSVLWVISLNPGQKQGAIARRLRIKPPHMTKVIQRLETCGYLARTIPDDDRRSVRLSLTAAGGAFVTAHRNAFFAYFRRDQQRLTDTELDALVALLRKYVRIEAAA